MEIQRRLTIRFTTIVAIILILSAAVIFFAATVSWRNEFYNRILINARSVAGVVVDEEGIDTSLMDLIMKKKLYMLPYEEIVILDQSGERVFSSRDSVTLPVDRVFTDKVWVRKVARIRQGNFYTVGFIYPGKSQNYKVFAGALDVLGYKKLSVLRHILIMVLFLSLVIAWFGGRLFSKRALSPIHQVIAEVNAIDEKKLNLRVNEGKSNDEITRLAKTFNQMLERIEKAFKMQRNFISNASHELRTPLSYIMGRLEVTASRERTNEEYKEEIHAVLEDMKILTQSTDKLLIFAQSNSEFAQLSFKPVRID